jgi:hypothetical protein
VTALRPGRFYAVRVCCTPMAAEVGAAPVVFSVVPSQLRVFRTQPTPPGPMQPPSLAQRARNALKVGVHRGRNLHVAAEPLPQQLFLHAQQLSWPPALLVPPRNACRAVPPAAEMGAAGRDGR